MIIKQLRDRVIRFCVVTGNPLSANHNVFDSPTFRSLCLTAIKKKGATTIDYNGVTFAFESGENALVSLPFMYRIDSTTYFQPAWLTLAESVYRDMLYTYMTEKKSHPQIIDLKQRVTTNIAEVKKLDPVLKWYGTSVVVVGSTTYKVMIPRNREVVADFLGTLSLPSSGFLSVRAYLIDKIAKDWLVANPGAPIDESRVEEEISKADLMNWADGHRVFESSYTRSVQVPALWDFSSPNIVWTAFTMFTSGNQTARREVWTRFVDKVQELYPELDVAAPTTAVHVTPYVVNFLIDAEVLEAKVVGPAKPELGPHHHYQLTGTASITGKTFDTLTVGDGVTSVIYRKGDCPSEVWTAFSAAPFAFNMDWQDFVDERAVCYKQALALLDVSFKITENGESISVHTPFYTGRVGWLLDMLIPEVVSTKGVLQYAD